MKHKLTYTDLAACSVTGMSVADTARWLNVSRSIVEYYANKFFISFERGSGKHQLNKSQLRGEPNASRAERAARMAEMYSSGSTLDMIGQEFDLTRERVRQILKAQYGMTWIDGGQHINSVKRVAKLASTRNERCLAKWGCTSEQWRTVPQDVRYAYQQKRNNVIRCYGSEAWALTLWEYHNIWQESGKERGRETWLTRLDPTRPFELSNVIVIANTDLPKVLGVRKKDLAM